MCAVVRESGRKRSREAPPPKNSAHFSSSPPQLTSPYAALDSPAPVTRAAAPASRPRAARRGTDCVCGDETEREGRVRRVYLTLCGGLGVPPQCGAVTG